MHDPMTFEARLADAFEAYAVGAPTGVDSSALAAELVTRRRPRPVSWRLGRPSARATRLALVAAIIAVTAIATLLVVGALRRPPEPFGGGRILVWFPSASGDGTAAVLAADGSTLWSEPLASRGCPRLVNGGAGIAVPGIGGIGIRSTEGAPQHPRLDTNYTGFERWSRNGRFVALVDTEGGPITIVDLQATDGRADTRYGADGSLAGVTAAVFSEDGSRLVVAVRHDTGVTDIRELRGGVDRLVASITTFADEPVELALTPDASRLAVALGAENRTALGRPRLLVVSMVDDTMQDARVPYDSSIPIGLVSWSPDGGTLAVRTGSGLVLFDAGKDTWTDTGAYFHGAPGPSRWSTDPAHPGIAMLDDSFHLHVTRFDGAPDKQYRLSGQWGAFSPDGSVVATAGSDDGATGGSVPVVSLVDLWGNADPRQLAEFPRPAAASSYEGPIGPRPAVDDQAPSPCIDWLPGGGS